MICEHCGEEISDAGEYELRGSSGVFHRRCGKLWDEQECGSCHHVRHLHEEKYGCNYEWDHTDAYTDALAMRCGCETFNEEEE